jgi:hypothetical protein
MRASCAVGFNVIVNFANTVLLELIKEITSALKNARIGDYCGLADRPIGRRSRPSNTDGTMLMVLTKKNPRLAPRGFVSKLGVSLAPERRGGFGIQ